MRLVIRFFSVLLFLLFFFNDSFVFYLFISWYRYIGK